MNFPCLFPKENKNLEIQFLRVLAILFVMIRHLPSFGHWSDGSKFLHTWQVFFQFGGGVDIFFVLSGYFMGILVLQRGPQDKALLSEKLNFTFSFWIRRAKRLLPASIFWASFFIWFVWDPNGRISPPDSHNHMLSEAYIGALLQVRNLQGVSRFPDLAHYWTLSLENQFYLCLPLAAFFLPRRRFWLLICAGIAFFSFWLPQWGFRPVGLLLGLIVWQVTSDPQTRAVLEKYIPAPTWKWKLGSLFLITALLLFPLALVSTFHESPESFASVSFSSAFLLLFASLNKGFIYIWQWLKPFIYWIGEWSYSIYLCHTTIFMLVNYEINKFHLPLHDSSLLLLLLIAPFIAGALSYFFIECRFYKAKALTV